MTSQLNIRVKAETREMIAALAALWAEDAPSSAFRPLTTSDVVRECVRRVYETETKKKEKRR